MAVITKDETQTRVHQCDEEARSFVWQAVRRPNADVTFSVEPPPQSSLPWIKNNGGKEHNGKGNAKADGRKGGRRCCSVRHPTAAPPCHGGCRLLLIPPVRAQVSTNTQQSAGLLLRLSWQSVRILVALNQVTPNTHIAYYVLNNTESAYKTLNNKDYIRSFRIA